MIGIFFAAILQLTHPVNAIVTDIEGTTTSISFVHETLFPYAKQNVEAYVNNHQQEVLAIAEEVQQIAGVTSKEVIPTLLQWMAQDKKITPLKTLQGLMWEDGYKQGAFKGHVYTDAAAEMHSWHEKGIPLYVYSSGSVHAQKLLFGYSDHGDLTPLFSGHFDTKVGGKREAASYTKIAEQIGLAPERILFLSDTEEELDAAHAAGMQTILLIRDEPKASKYQSVTNFNEIGLP